MKTIIVCLILQCWYGFHLPHSAVFISFQTILNGRAILIALQFPVSTDLTPDGTECYCH
jgi:hypothetical protein